MKPGSWQRLARNTALEAAVVLLLYGLLYWGASSTDVVARLFAVNEAIATGDVALALGFVLTRITALVLLPGFVAYRLARIGIALVMDRYSKSRGKPRGKSAAIPTATTTAPPTATDRLGNKVRRRLAP